MAGPNQVVYAFLGLPGGVEWVVILVVALLLFGRRLPEIMRGLGSSVRSFRRGMEDEENRPPPPPPPPPPVDGAVSRPGEVPHQDPKA